MKNLLIFLFVLIFISFTFGQEDEIIFSKNFITTISKGEYEKAIEFFDPSVRTLISSSKLREIWEGIIKQVGEYKNIIGERVEDSGVYKIVYVTTKFTEAYIDIKVVFLNKKIVGLFFLPAQIQEGYRPPSYVNLSSFEEIDVKIGKILPLPGKLTLPKGNFPVPIVIFVHGSGPNDMDETIGPNKPFRDLAWGLATLGIASLKYDKRTKVYPDEFSRYKDGFTVMEEVIEDVLSAIEFVKNYENIDKSRIYILGHSLGGMLAPRIASLSKDIKGIIIMAGPTRPMEDLIWEQTNYIANLDGKIDENERAQLDIIKKEIEKIKDSNLLEKSPPNMYILGAPVKYWVDLKSYDPVNTLYKLNISALILQGERDYQVTLEDFKEWLKLSTLKNITFKLYPNLNHLFMEGIEKSSPEEYNKEGHIPEYIIKDIANWIKENY